MRASIIGCAVWWGLLLTGQAPAAEVPQKYRPAVKKGLEWLVKQQHKDGHWDAQSGQYSTALTALGGMALLMEGSTTAKGKYAANLRRAADWLIARSQKGGGHDGLIGNPNDPSEGARYMFGHGYGLLFLACVYDVEEDKDRRRKLGDVLNRAVKFSSSAQTTRGGWGYVTAKDGNDFDEGASTQAQIHGLYAARNAGIPVPRALIDSIRKYLEKATTARGGIVYSLASGGGGADRIPLTAAALSGAAATRQLKTPEAKKWLKFCQTSISLRLVGRTGFDEYTHHYYAQAVYILGDAGYAKLFPQARKDDQLRWSAYREALFDHLLRIQHADGSWASTGIGPVYGTSLYLAVLQLDNAALPLYQR
jgi:Prenyltransferase and squalene oxidase repeat